MMQKIMACMLLLLIGTSSVLAITTEVTVTTTPNSYAMIRFFEAGSKTNLLQTFFDRYTDFNNQVRVTHDSETSFLDIEVYIKDKPNGATVHYKKYTRVQAGTPFNVTLPDSATSPAPDALEEETPIANTTVNETIQTETQPLTGNVIKEKSTLGSVPWYYFLVAALFLAVLIGGARFMQDKKGTKRPTAPKDPPGKSKDPAELEQKLQEAQKRLDDATKEIATMKNQERIKEIQKNIDTEQEQIRKLQQGLG